MREAESIGIEVTKADVTIENNAVDGSPHIGIQLGDRATTQVANNTVTGPGDQDLDGRWPLWDPVSCVASMGAITGNRITNHVNADPERTACGIVIDPGGGP